MRLVLFSVIGAFLMISPAKDSAASGFERWMQRAQASVGMWRPPAVTQLHDCTRGIRPDPDCTPGHFDADQDKPEICSALSPRQVSVPAENLRQVRRAYGSRRAIDLLIGPGLGGTSARANLWPIHRRHIARKRKIEQILLHRVCAGRISLNEARYRLASDWLRALDA